VSISIFSAAAIRLWCPHSPPGDPHSIEFWQAYRVALGDNAEPMGRTFNDLIAAYKIAPEFTNRAQATRDDYALSQHHQGGLGPPSGERREAEECLEAAGCLGGNAGCREPPAVGRQDPDQLGHPARIL
jgi:hypothetical protein